MHYIVNGLRGRQWSWHSKKRKPVLSKILFYSVPFISEYFHVYWLFFPRQHHRYRDMNSGKPIILCIWKPNVQGPVFSRRQSSDSITNNTAWPQINTKYLALAVLFSQIHRYIWSFFPVLKNNIKLYDKEVLCICTLPS